ncbi:MAG: hypothetical protein K2X87_22270, partial [Gemmataceae bacterium]|nr:hypothetical protein [Gemmataceae bacterium]
MVGGADGPAPLRVYRVADGAAVGAVGRGVAPEHGRVAPAGFTPAGHVLLEGDGPDISAWDPATGAKVRDYGLKSPGGYLSPDGRTLAAADGGDVVFFDAATGRELRRAAVVPRDLVWWSDEACRVCWSADGRTAGVLLPGGLFVVLDAEAGRVVRRFEPATAEDRRRRLNGVRTMQGRETGLAVRLSPDGRWAAAAGDGLATLWETATGRGLGPVGPPGADDAAFHPDGRSLVVCHHGYADRVDLVRWFDADPAGPPAVLWDRAADAPDGGAVVRAAFALVASADGRKLLAEKLPPARDDPAEAGRVRGWVADLGSDDFKSREAASKELAARARAFEPVLREA